MSGWFTARSSEDFFKTWTGHVADILPQFSTTNPYT